MALVADTPASSPPPTRAAIDSEDIRLPRLPVSPDGQTPGFGGLGNAWPAATRLRYHRNRTLLAAEWVDIKNTGRSSVDLSDVTLYHKAFKRDGSFEWDLVVKLSGVLGAGQVLRIHSGKGPFSVVRTEDKVGSDYYMFTGQSRYIWNNDYCDASLLWQPSIELRIDEASYDPYPPEGVILQRVGSKLVHISHTATKAVGKIFLENAQNTGSSSIFVAHSLRASGKSLSLPQKNRMRVR